MRKVHITNLVYSTVTKRFVTDTVRLGLAIGEIPHEITIIGVTGVEIVYVWIDRDNINDANIYKPCFGHSLTYLKGRTSDSLHGTSLHIINT